MFAIGRLALSMVCLGLVVAGCGGSSGMSREDVQQSTWDWLKAKVPATTSLDDVGCVDNGGGKWSCLTTARPSGGGAPVQVQITVTCDKVNCLYQAS